MENRSPYSRDMPAEQAYQDPNTTQMGSHVGPYFSNAANDQSPVISDQVQQAADLARQLAVESQESPHSNGVQDYGPHQAIIEAGLRVEEDMRQPSSPERMAQSVMNMGGQQQYGSNMDGPRKRTKVSRACDECRRKKIRCDATDIEGEQCSSCRRTGIPCRFSRQPLKRGPSKGYIKELADRLNSLESQLSSPQHHQQPPPQDYSQMPYDDMSQLREYSPPPSASRKRTLSVSESNMTHRDQTYAPARADGNLWSPDMSRNLPPLGTLVNTQLPQNIPPDPLLTRPQLTNNNWRYEDNRHETQGIPLNPETREIDLMAPLDWDEGVIDEYYRIIHQTFPLLPHSKARLRARLLQCPPTLREAFLTALDTSVRSSPSTLLAVSGDVRQSTRRAAELIALSQYDNPASRTPSAHLVYIQALILMALESDNHGPATMRGQVGPPRAEWLGRAMGMATHLKLNIPKSRDRFAEGDPDSDEKLGRRVWWILFILDRWHASSTSCLLQVADSSSSLLPEDQILLGESTYHLARLSFILGHVCQIMQQPASLMSPSSAAAPIISTTILGEIDRFRESVESMLLGAPNLVHLCYWHVRLLVLRLTASTTPHELLTPASRMASILNSSHTMITPLNHHFAALSAVTLVELMEFDETRANAERGIGDLVEALGSHRGLMSKENSTGWDSAIRELVVCKGRKGIWAGINGERDGVSSGTTGAGLLGLQHLADAAIAGKRPQDRQQDGVMALDRASLGLTEDAANAAGYDAQVVVRYGYLAALVQDDKAAASGSR